MYVVPPHPLHELPSSVYVWCVYDVIHVLELLTYTKMG